jgi:hypothetical protein
MEHGVIFVSTTFAFHIRILTILYDKTGAKCTRGTGLRALAGGAEVASSPLLNPLKGTLAKSL